jgi:uncharacterized protein
MPGESAGTGQDQQTPSSGAGAGYTMPASEPGGYPPGPGPSSGSGYAPTPSSGGGYTPPPPTSGGGYTPPPTSGGGYTPPTSGAGGYTPTSGAGGYTPPPGSGGGYMPAGGAYPASGPAYPGYPAGPGGQPGYPSAGGYGTPPGYPTPDDKTWAMLAHWGGLAGVLILGGVFGWIGPLIAYASKGKESPTVRAHALNTLNFHLTWAGVNVIAWIVTVCTIGLGWPLLLVTYLATAVIGLIGSIKATNGEFWPYPATINLIK